MKPPPTVRPVLPAAQPPKTDNVMPPADAPLDANIAAHLPRMAATVPDQPAVVVVRSRDRTGRPCY
ncbi:MAG: hypothetical protein ACE5E6_05705, partial [Phycisphaerae bacterium]